MNHRMKTWAEYFQDVRTGRKSFRGAEAVQFGLLRGYAIFGMA
jgi:hypothetical protein